MHIRSSICAAALMTLVTASAAQTSEGAKYPDWKGKWAALFDARLGGQPTFDQTKPWGRGQQAPLTPEYQQVLEDSIADQAKGGQGNYINHASCMPGGMPQMTTAFAPLEVVVTPDTTYILLDHRNDNYRRIFTDGRDWPKNLEPTYAGYSIGRWIDEDGDGVYDVLVVETRGPFKGPRVYDGTGLPLHFDNQSIFKERIYRDKADPNILHDEVTVIDHALTRPWTVDKKYRRDPNPHPDWEEANCTEVTMLVVIGKELYVLSAGGLLMPAKKDQPPPDLRYFNRTAK